MIKVKAILKRTGEQFNIDIFEFDCKEDPSFFAPLSMKVL